MSSPLPTDPKKPKSPAPFVDYSDGEEDTFSDSNEILVSDAALSVEPAPISKEEPPIAGFNLESLKATWKAALAARKKVFNIDDGEEVPVVSVHGDKERAVGDRIKIAGNLIEAAGYSLFHSDIYRISKAGTSLRGAGDEISKAGRRIRVAYTVVSKIDAAKVIITAGNNVILAGNEIISAVKDQNVPAEKEEVGYGREEAEFFGKVASCVIWYAGEKIFANVKDICAAEADLDGRKVVVAANRIINSGKELVAGGNMLVEAAEKDFGDPPAEEDDGSYPEGYPIEIARQADPVLWERYADY